jgi:RNA recognition motif-containing protein
MNTKIYVENLADATTETELMDLFSTCGNVADVNIAVDADRKSRCFARVTMVTPEGARAAIQALNGKTVGTATLAVSEWWSSPASIH